MNMWHDMENNRNMSYSEEYIVSSLHNGPKQENSRANPSIELGHWPDAPFPRQ